MSVETVTTASALALVALAPLGLGHHLKPQAMGVAVCGLLMSSLYPQGILRKYKISRSQLVNTDLFLHFLPALIAMNIPGNPDPTFSLLLSLAIGTVSIGLDPWRAYPGAPTWLFGTFFGAFFATLYYSR
jgi:hypothetical protein